MEKCDKVAALYLASLKALVLIHQHNHWTARGNDFYGNHLLFQRLYEAALEDVDSIAERFIGLFGDEFIGYEHQFTLLSKVLLKYNDLANSPLELSLKIEEDFIKFANNAYKCFEAEGKLTLGLEDLLPAISSKREEACYLLKQALDKGNEVTAKKRLNLLKKYAQDNNKDLREMFFEKAKKLIFANLKKAFPEIKVGKIELHTGPTSKKIEVNLFAENTKDLKKIKMIIVDAVFVATEYMFSASPVLINGQLIQ